MTTGIGVVLDCVDPVGLAEFWAPALGYLKVGAVARRVEREAYHEHGNNWIVMADPESNKFCVCDGGAGG